MKRRGSAFLVTAALAAAAFGFGVYRQEFREVLINAALICLSCIGVG
jgi:hypothetical protein